MKRLISITALCLAISFTPLKIGVAIDREGMELTTLSSPVLICPLPRAVILRQLSQRINSSHFDYMDLYTKPAAKSKVKNEIKGQSVEKDFMSFYISPKTVNTTTLLKGDYKSDEDKDYIIVFGVRVPRNKRL